MEKAAGTYVIDVRWWLTFQKAVLGEKGNIQQACTKK